MEKVNQVILSLGSNIEDRLFFLKSAISKIEKTIGKVTKKSAIYESEALGFQSEIPFYNLCIEVETAFDPFELLNKTQKIETEIGRTKKTSKKYESRKIDIDIIFFGDEAIDSESLQIPHKLFTERKFVLLPLNEIYEGVGIADKPIKIGEIIAKCKDESFVQKTTFVI